MTGKQIEEVYNSLFRNPFPYEDCRRLGLIAKISMDDLIPALDLYLSNIAGYSSSASRLTDRAEDDLARAQETLVMDFFEAHPYLQNCRGLITREQTPRLFEELQIAETLRLALIQLITSGMAEGPD